MFTASDRTCGIEKPHGIVKLNLIADRIYHHMRSQSGYCGFFPVINHISGEESVAGKLFIRIKK